MPDLHTLAPDTRSILLTALYVFALLVVSTATWATLQWRAPQRDWSELGNRIKAWWYMAALFFFAVGVSSAGAIVLVALMSFWAMKEFVTLIDTRRADHGALVWLFLAIPVQYAWVYVQWYGMFVIFIPVYVFLALPTRLVLAGQTQGFVASMSRIQWGAMAFVFGVSHLAFLTVLPLGPPEVSGRTLLLFLACVVELSDVFQYVWGKLLGRHKIIPTVSPNKTWEGFVGGIGTACLVSLALRFLTPFTPVECLLVSLLVCVAGFFGGAVMSAVKRDLGVKDFGSVIPGHGGVLDRIDSLCYAAPLFFHYVRYVYV
jgi:phosphatidate cytidylyltransferase